MFTEEEIKEMLENYKFRLTNRGSKVCKSYIYDISERVFNLIEDLNYLNGVFYLSIPDSLRNLQIKFDIRKQRNKNIFIPTLKVLEYIEKKKTDFSLVSAPIDGSKQEAEENVNYINLRLKDLEGELNLKIRWSILGDIRKKIKSLKEESFYKKEEVIDINEKLKVIEDKIAELDSSKRSLIDRSYDIEDETFKETVDEIIKNDYVIKGSEFDKEIVKEFIENLHDNKNFLDKYL